MIEPWSPPGERAATVIAFFVILTIVLHLGLVHWRPLSKRAWKRVDYLWLAFAALGLIGAIGEVRTSTASAQTDAFRGHVSQALNNLQSEVAFLSREPGAICRTFTVSEFSPPAAEFKRIQREYDNACGWAKQLARRVPSVAPSPPERIDPASLPRRPHLSESPLIEMADEFDHQLGNYNAQAQKLRDLMARSERSGLEWTFVLASPFLLGAALALRITKVTGELRLER